jgi:hypothetical protein
MFDLAPVVLALIFVIGGFKLHEWATTSSKVNDINASETTVTLVALAWVFYPAVAVFSVIGLMLYAQS